MPTTGKQLKHNVSIRIKADTLVRLLTYLNAHPEMAVVSTATEAIEQYLDGKEFNASQVVEPCLIEVPANAFRIAHERQKERDGQHEAI